MKDLKVSNETHSLLFSIKNNLIASNNMKFTYDEVMKVLIDLWHQKLDKSKLDIMKHMYQLEEKQ